MFRLAPRPLRESLGDWGTVLVLAVMLGLACWGTWEFLPRGDREQLVSATVVDLRRDWPRESGYALVREPFAAIAVALPDGRVTHVRGDIHLLQRCRKGRAIELVTWKTNSGGSMFDLAPNPCDPRQG